MKKVFALCLVVILCLALTVGCKKKAAPTAPTAPAVPGTTQTSGSLTVFVPESWTLVADPVRKDQIYLCKGGSDLNTVPYIKLTLGGALPSESICNDVQSIPSATYGALVWSGFSGTKSGSQVTYLITHREEGNILATLWNYQGQFSLEDLSVQAILGGVTSTAPQAEPETPLPTDPAISIAGDWSGTMSLTDYSGEFEEKGGASYKAIARILIDENGNMTPYIGLAKEGGEIKDLTCTPATEEMGAQVTGTWNGVPFDHVDFMIEGGKLSIQIPLYSGDGSALMVMTMDPLTDGSFETLAAELGCTGYPSK